ncbi:glutathione-disulfide reductase [Sphingobium phenoxybenzoativorans]|uniref:Glutathione-disulfide reductase n=1 Tax=Sphingobium phenoxybenzoativorans TaxID=1592790 RepID=A0A975Q0E0_9SPHN|nr:glutathione-disulfide reductase [Sphingobium phenoxybenzoativorans]QUT04526.1 glutathione-disulfide reductase [Sphingobium phenoxybenzoativorans]
MATFDFDLVVIGGGSGGVRAARIAAGHGARVALAEEHLLGGTCVIRGCVPKKLFVYGSHFAEDLRDARRFGWRVPTPEFDWITLRDNVLSEVMRLEGLYRQTLGNAGVTIYGQRATLSGEHEVTLDDGTVLTAAKILIATGARPALPPIPGTDLGITSNEVFHIDHLPERIIITGGGYIANEFAGIFNKLGSKVTLLNRTSTMLRGYDEQIRDRLIQISTLKGIDIRFEAQIERIEKADDASLNVMIANGEEIPTDCVLFATGRLPNSAGMGLEDLGVEFDPVGAIVVDERFRTAVPSIFAVGDVINRVQLTPVAIREGHAFADTEFGGKPRSVDYDCIPSAVFSHPPLAAVGLTEAQAREQFGGAKIYTSDFRPMRNVLADRNERALYKMVCHPETHRVLGLHMIGPDAPEILQAAAVAVKAGLTKDAFDDTVALHPSMAEELVLMR